MKIHKVRQGGISVLDAALCCTRISLLAYSINVVDIINFHISINLAKFSPELLKISLRKVIQGYRKICESSLTIIPIISCTIDKYLLMLLRIKIGYCWYKYCLRFGIRPGNRSIFRCHLLRRFNEFNTLLSGG